MTDRDREHSRGRKRFVCVPCPISKPSSHLASRSDEKPRRKLRMSRAHLPYHNIVRAKHRIYIRGHAATQLSISGQRQWNDREWVPLRNQQSQFPIFTTSARCARSDSSYPPTSRTASRRIKGELAQPTKFCRIRCGRTKPSQGGPSTEMRLTQSFSSISNIHVYAQAAPLRQRIAASCSSSLSRCHTSSASRGAMYRPDAFAIARFRAAATPRFSW